MKHIKAKVTWKDGYQEYKRVPLLPTIHLYEFDRSDKFNTDETLSMLGALLFKHDMKHEEVQIKICAFNLIEYSDGSIEYREV